MTTAVRLADFLAQMDHESMGFTRLVEDMRYSADRLVQVFGRRKFPTDDSAHEAVKGGPWLIANIVYAGINGNGNIKSGDGWRYRGRALPQLTGLKNYLRAERHFDVPLVRQPELAEEPVLAARIGAWFFAAAGCNELADANDFDGECDVINIGRKTVKVGDANGYAHRLSRRAYYRDGLGLPNLRKDPQ